MSSNPDTTDPFHEAAAVCQQNLVWLQVLLREFQGGYDFGVSAQTPGFRHFASPNQTGRGVDDDMTYVAKHRFFALALSKQPSIRIRLALVGFVGAHVPTENEHPFQSSPNSDSNRNRTPIPIQNEQVFQSKSNTYESVIPV